MATIGTLKTISDWSKEVDPDGSVAAVAEVMSQKNQIIDSFMFKESNLPTGERVSVSTGLPTPFWRMVNRGVPATKATTAQVSFQCGQLTDRSEVDATIARLNGNLAEFRMNESKPHIEGIAQEGASKIFYGSSTNPEEIVGLSNIYTSTSDGNGDNIILGGGSGSDNTSVWLIGMGDNEIYGVYPKGSQAGIVHEDLGLGDAFDSDNNRFRAYMDYYEWNLGVVVKDWRYASRIPNIDVSDLLALTGTQATTASTFLPKLMARQIDRLPELTGVKPMFYMNRTAASLLRVAAMEKASSAVTIEEGLNQFGKTIHQLKFLGIPVGISDALVNTESLVS